MAQATHAFIRVDSLTPPIGPFKIKSRAEKFYTYIIVDFDVRQDVVSLDRLKPAFMPAGTV